MAETDSRPWRTDHAGASPYTIEPGYFEAEVEAVRFSYSDQNSSVLVLTAGGPGPGPGGTGGDPTGGAGEPRLVRIPAHQITQAWTYGGMVLKAGILENLDLEVSLAPWKTITTDLRIGPNVFDPVAFHTRMTLSGFGDTTAELKLNIWGNDGGSTALAVLGAVKFPTADEFLGNNLYEGGPALLFTANLPLQFEARINTRATFVSPPRSHLTATFENLISLLHPLTDTVDAYAAFDTFVSTQSEADWGGQVRVGLNYRPWRNVELFTGSDFAVQPRTGTYAPFLGFSVLF
jgi:hypothetical protein